MPVLRVQLKPNQIAAALYLAGVSPTSRSPLTDLPAVSSDATARKSLQGTDLLDAGRDSMSATTKAALAALADPRLSIVIMANRAASPEWVDTMLLTHGRDEPFVAYAGNREGADLAILPTPSHAVALIDQLAGLTQLPAASTNPPVDLDVPSFAAAVAAADVVQATKLEGMLDREGDGGEITLTAAALEDALARGMAATDPRWAVDAARVVSPPVFTEAAGRMADGLAGLQAAGLVSNGRGPHTLTPTGSTLALSLGRLMGSSGLTIAAAGPDGEVGASHLGILRSIDSIWMVAWRELSATDARVTLHQASTTTALRLVNALVDPLSSPDDDEAPAATPTRRKRATTADRAAARPERAARPARPERATATTTWAPTHAVPAGGLPTWAEADPNDAQTAPLDGGLQVQVDATQAAWAHVVCSNGWSAWLDGRALEEL